MTCRTMTTLAALAAGLLALAACSRSEPEAPVDENATSEASAPVENDAPAAPLPAAPVSRELPAASNSAAADVPPEPEVAPDVQMLDDAEATGMTARVSRDEAPAANDQAPE